LHPEGLDLLEPRDRFLQAVKRGANRLLDLIRAFRFQKPAGYFELSFEAAEVSGCHDDRCAMRGKDSCRVLGVGAIFLSLEHVHELNVGQVPSRFGVRFRADPTELDPARYRADFLIRDCHVAAAIKEE
jgi:hypothetical protein